MLLSKLFKILKKKQIYNYNKDKLFSSITSNSKLTNSKTIFFYDKNSKIKKKYLDEVVKNKTPAIISNRYLRSLKITQFIVDDLNQEIELLLKNLYKNLPVKSIAITGTNGKTSVVWYISKILNLLNYSNSTVGTLGYYVNGKKINDINLTTPSFEDLYKYGSPSKVEDNIFIFEASSHALDQDRIKNYPINIAALTNISKDHLDYHKTMLKYKKAKYKLFINYLDKNGNAIINNRIKKISILKNKLDKRGIKINNFGKKNIFLERRRNYINLNIFNKEYNIQNLKLITDIELENLECAIACCLALNINVYRIIETLPFVTNPPGRFQTLYYKRKKSKIIIDYAHTPEALERILKTLNTNKTKPSLVFGCGGQRDKTKRKLMGIIANNFANRIYITDDNPRFENPVTIRKDIIKYCRNGIEIPNRKKAIIRAINDLKLNETLIIAGKGHEKIQIIKNKKIKFDDVEIVKNLIK